MRLAFYLAILGGGLALVLFSATSGHQLLGMATDELARAVLLTTMALAVGAMILPRGRGHFRAALEAGVFWAIVMAALAVGYGYKDDLGQLGGRTIGVLMPGTPMETGRRGEAEVRRSRDGHFHVAADVDGARIRFMVDTGASSVVLTDDDARRAGIDPDRLIFDLDVATANGRTRAAEVRLGAIAVGDIRVTGVRAMVTRPGQLETSLLGNTFLSRLHSFTVEGSRLTMRL
jgi:aspartyl protease family protein